MKITRTSNWWMIIESKGNMETFDSHLSSELCWAELSWTGSVYGHSLFSQHVLTPAGPQMRGCLSAAGLAGDRRFCISAGLSALTKIKTATQFLPSFRQNRTTAAMNWVQKTAFPCAQGALRDKTGNYGSILLLNLINNVYKYKEIKPWSIKGLFVGF